MASGGYCSRILGTAKGTENKEAEEKGASEACDLGTPNHLRFWEMQRETVKAVHDASGPSALVRSVALLLLPNSSFVQKP